MGSFVRMKPKRYVREKLKMFVEVKPKNLMREKNKKFYKRKLEQFCDLMNMNGFEVDGFEEKYMFESWNDKREKCIYSPIYETYNRRWKSKRKKKKKGRKYR